MPRYAVRQPDERFAIFSTVVDSFVAADLTASEAFEHLRTHMSQADAEAKVHRAAEDSWEGMLGDPPDAPPGLRRWTDALQTILAIHGEDELREMLDEIDGAKAPDERSD